MRKNIILLLFFIILFVYFLYQPSEFFAASKDGIFLWATQIVPTLLPFSIISQIMITMPSFQKMYPIFTSFCGFLFGMPIGAKLAGTGYQSHLLSKNTAQKIINYSNNLSPSFILIYIFTNKIPTTFSSIQILSILYLTPALLLTIYFIKNQHSCFVEIEHTNIHTISIEEATTKSITQLIKMCSYILFFSIAIRGIINFLPAQSILTCFIISLLEITNGIELWSKINVLCSYDYLLIFLNISFNGICCMAQTISILKECHLSVNSYIKTKVLLTILSGLQAALLLFID